MTQTSQTQPSGAMPPLLPAQGLMQGFQRHTVKTRGAEINVVIAGEGPPLLLLHGNPLTHVSWHKIAPTLAKSFTVIAPDLRGYGDSSKPDGGPDHAAYTFRAMGEDAFDVMDHFGFSQFAWQVTTGARAWAFAWRLISHIVSHGFARWILCRPIMF